MPRELELWLVAVVVLISVAYVTYDEPTEQPTQLVSKEPVAPPSATAAEIPHNAAGSTSQVVAADPIPWLDDAVLAMAESDHTSDESFVARGGQREPYLYPGQDSQSLWPPAILWDDRFPKDTAT